MSNEKISLSEKGKNLIIHKDKPVKVNFFKPEDKFPFLKSESKCDYIIELENYNKALFVELKGNKFEKAVHQLENTVLKLKNHYKNFKKCCYIIGRTIPPSTETTSIKQRFRKKYNATLETKTKACNLKVSNLINCDCKCL